MAPPAELTLEGLRSLELLDAAATPGPWVVSTPMDQIWRGPIQSTRGSTKGLTKDACPLFSIEPDNYYHLNDDEAARRAARADRNLVAEMRTRLPALLVAARRLLELERALAWLRMEGVVLTGFDLNPEAFLTKAMALGWPGLPEPEGPTMCETCEDEAATCFHAEDKQHLCDDCCDHVDGCNPLEVRP
jgi:hypothetical protein